MSEQREIDPKTGFPKIINGSCDGMGCGKGYCFCNEFVAMKEEFQRIYNKQWKDDDAECERIERIWRFGTSRACDVLEKIITEDKKFYRTVIDAEKEELRNLRITVHQYKNGIIKAG